LLFTQRFDRRPIVPFAGFAQQVFELPMLLRSPSSFPPAVSRDQFRLNPLIEPIQVDI
jgi:hypothetical protein